MYRQKIAKFIIIILIIIMATVSTNVYAITYTSTNNICKIKNNNINKTKIIYRNKIKKQKTNNNKTKEIIKTKVEIKVEIPEQTNDTVYSFNDIIYAKAENYLTYTKGVVYYNNHKETYYAEEVLPGPGLNIPVRHVAYDGTIRDENSYIVVASDLSFYPRGSIVETSLGLGKVYDTGCAYGTIDIYVNAAKFSENSNTNII